MKGNSMENVELARIIDEVQYMKDAVTDISNRISDPAGFVQRLEKVGIQTGYCKRDVISLEMHLAKLLKVARQTLSLWEEADRVAKST